MPLLKNNRRRFLSSAIKLVYIRGAQRRQFKRESYFRRWRRSTVYALRTRNTNQLVSQLSRMLFEWLGIPQFISQSGFSFDNVFFSFTAHCCFMAILKNSMFFKFIKVSAQRLNASFVKETTTDDSLSQDLDPAGFCCCCCCSAVH